MYDRSPVARLVWRPLILATFGLAIVLVVAAIASAASAVASPHRAHASAVNQGPVPGIDYVTGPAQLQPPLISVQMSFVHATPSLGHATVVPGMQPLKSGTGETELGAQASLPLQTRPSSQ